jgi:hypothetical protein
MNATAQCLLVLIVPPTLEEPLVDWLLDCPSLSGFSTTAIHGHGSGQAGLSAIEQVTGRRRRVQFQLHVTWEQAQTILAGLQRDLPEADVHYWLLPLVDSGRLTERRRRDASP